MYEETIRKLGYEICYRNKTLEEAKKEAYRSYMDSFSVSGLPENYRDKILHDLRRMVAFCKWNKFEAQFVPIGVQADLGESLVDVRFLWPPIDIYKAYHQNKNMRKILFLDVDGVLNSDNFRDGDYPYYIDPNCLSQLLKIVQETSCEIVLSSNWRFSLEGISVLRRKFLEVGISQEIIENTPYLPAPRHKEIALWLSENPEVSSWCVVDDIQEAILDPLRTVLTNPRWGLTEDDATDIIRILNEEIK